MKTVDIKGKAYVLVSERLLHFNENYKNGSIRTELVSAVDAEMVVIKATVYPDCSDMNRYFTGYSQATWGDCMVNKTAALENCETSAVGRALGMMGIGVLDSVASADEVKKAITQPAYVPKKDFLKEVTSRPGEEHLCMFCGTSISDGVAAYSMKNFNGKKICMDCQKEPMIPQKTPLKRKETDDDYDESVGN